MVVTEGMLACSLENVFHYDHRFRHAIVATVILVMVCWRKEDGVYINKCEGERGHLRLITFSRDHNPPTKPSSFCHDKWVIMV